MTGDRSMTKNILINDLFIYNVNYTNCKLFFNP